MNIELEPIAQKKLDQMGATVHGVLVKNEAGAWAAVSEGGRVMWLDDFEGQAARAQSGQGAEVVARHHATVCYEDCQCEHGNGCKLEAEYGVHPQPAQQWAASGVEYDRAIHHNPDAKAWADLFMQTFPHCGADPETMCGWFANAMMAMYDHVKNTQPQPAQQGSVPEGWRLVPENATSEMVFAPQFGVVEHSIKPSVLFEVWRAMLSAAPQPPKEGKGDE